MPRARSTTPLLLLLAACEAGAPARVEAPADSAAGEVPFELAGLGGAAVLVPVYLNGQGPFQFVLDTGATLTCVDARLADSLALPASRGKLGVGAGVGGSGRLRLVQLDSVRVGTARVVDAPGCVLDLRHIGALGLEVDGLLGLNVLRRFRVTLDFRRRVLILQDPEPGGR